MADPLTIKRSDGSKLFIVKHGSRYDVAISGGPNLSTDEIDQIAAYIADDPDGASTLAKLRAR